MNIHDEQLLNAFENLSDEEKAAALLVMLGEVTESEIEERSAVNIDATIATHGDTLLEALRAHAEKKNGE